MEALVTGHSPISRLRKHAADRSHTAEAIAVQVILVEGDDLYRDAVEAELIDEGFTVCPFKDWQAMRAAAAEGLRADMVVLDWEVENRLGVDLLSQMRAEGLRWPVIFLAAHNSPMHEWSALQRGAADFVDRARGTAVLAARLRKIASEKRNGFDTVCDEVFHCGRLTLRPGICRAYWDGIDVGLTISEFKIVRLLVANAGSFFTYRQIYDCIRHTGFIAGTGQDGYRTNVRSAIKRIRDKFKMHCPDFDEIQTYASFGYRWGRM